MQSLKSAYTVAQKTNATKFSDIGIRGNLLSSLEKQFKIVHPTLSQKAFIPAILSGADLFIRDITGSGKTFGLALAAVAYPRFVSASHQSNVARSNNDQITESEGDEMNNGKVIYDEDVIHDQSLDSDLNIKQKDNNADLLQFSTSKKLNKKQDRYTHTLIMVPTRDLAIQVFDWIKGFSSSYIHENDVGYMVQCIISGPEIESQKDLLRKYTPRIVVGTPNRLLELFNSKDLNLARLRLLIVDEADRIVSCTSAHAPVKKRFNAIVHKLDGETLIEKLFRRTEDDKAKIQVVACSASINSPLRNTFKRNLWVEDAIHVDTTGSLILPTTLEHHAFVVQEDGLYSFDWSVGDDGIKTGDVGDGVPSRSDEQNAKSVSSVSEPKKAISDELNDNNAKKSINSASNKFDASKDEKTATLPDDHLLVVESIKYLIDEGKFSSGFIFTSSSISVRKLVANLQLAGLDALRFIDIRNYEEKSQSQSLSAEISLPNWLVLTEHEARGLDLPKASVVFILGPPSSPQSYLHMAGRVGRAGRNGTVISLLGGPKYETKFNSMASILKISPSKTKIK